MIAPKFATLLAFVSSSLMVIGDADARPHFRPHPRLGHEIERITLLKARHHHHGHHGHHRHHSHEYDSGHTKVYADDPLIISGNNNHVHSHSHSRSHRRSHDDHHRHHGHHGHHGTKVYADDPLIVSGDNNHVHSHSHKRLDQGTPQNEQGTRHHQQLASLKSPLLERGPAAPLIPLLNAVPGLPGIIDLVDIASHTAPSDKVASLVISPKPNGVNAQSTAGDNDTSGFIISASNTSSSVMYLLTQNVSAPLALSEKAVLITTPMFDQGQQSLRMYCATYNSSLSAPTQISSEPCISNATMAARNSTSSHIAQLFSWNTSSGEITPLWSKDVDRPIVDTTSAPGGAPDPASQGDGYVVGQYVAPVGGDQSSASVLSMVFRAVDTLSPEASPSIDSTNTNTVPDLTYPSGAEANSEAPDDIDENSDSYLQDVAPPSTASVQEASMTSCSTAIALEASTTAAATASSTAT